MGRKYAIIGCSIGTLLAWAPGAAQGPDTHVSAQIDAINARYQQEWEQIRQDAGRIKDEAPEGPENVLTIDCEMKEQEIKLDIPEVTMRLREMSLDLPQVTMKRNTIVWDNPETFMGTTNCGWYPEFRGFPPRVTMREIRCDLPQVRMVRREASLDIPEFKWDRASFSMHVPEFRMETQRWVFDLPECEELSVATQHVQDDSRRLESRATELAGRQQQEVKAAVLSDLARKRDAADASFRVAASQIEAAISKVREQGIDPTRVRLSDGGTIDLIAQLGKVNSQRETELAKLDQTIRQMSA